MSAVQGPHSSSIGIFLRVKPVARPSAGLYVDDTDQQIKFNLPKALSLGPVNNQRENYHFSFNGVLTAAAKQEEVFERVARNVVLGTLEGFNGTIFAYGQTGSGKTFTVTGGPERYSDRGIIPRSISVIFDEIAKRAEFNFLVHVSYLEIYNEVGYDLLDPDRDVRSLEDLPRVHVMEDDDGAAHMRNLSSHRAASEEDALNLLFLGDTNRTISETPLNQASSRSHCIFTVVIESRRPGEPTVRRSKLNLVDLAGSERVSRTGIDGGILKEARYINLSLHYLEQVIIALQERSSGGLRGHVPYRNSTMTMVLRDSLGGNCRTVMIANITAQHEMLDESISTCRFAQRVALVANHVTVNEDIDPDVVIRRLRQDVRELKDEVRMLRGEGEDRGPLTPDEIERVNAQTHEYVQDPSPEAGVSFGGSMLFINAAFRALKQAARGHLLVAAKGREPIAAKGHTVAPGLPHMQQLSQPSVTAVAAPQEIQQLTDQIRQRDSEIAILVGLVKQARAAGFIPSSSPDPQTSTPGLSTSRAAASGTRANLRHPGPAHAGGLEPGRDVRRSISMPSQSSSGSNLTQQARSIGPASSSAGGDSLPDPEVLADRSRAFEAFRISYSGNPVIDANKAQLKIKYEEAKACGQQVNASKQSIEKLKGQIDRHRTQRALADMGRGLSNLEQELEPDDREMLLHEQVEEAKVRYKESFGRLRTLKSEIEHLHRLLEHNRLRLQHDFELWLSDARERTGVIQPGNTLAAQPREEAGTPDPPAQQNAYAADIPNPDLQQQHALTSVSWPKDDRLRVPTAVSQATLAGRSGKDPGKELPAEGPLQTAEGPLQTAEASSAPQQSVSGVEEGMADQPQDEQPHTQRLQSTSQYRLQQQQEESIFQSPLPSSRNVKPPIDKSASRLHVDMSRLHAAMSSQQAGSAQPEGAGPARASDGLPAASAADRAPYAHGTATAASRSQAGSSGESEGLAVNNQQQASRGEAFPDLAHEAMQAAAPYLTGNKQADEDIIKFYQARTAILRSSQRLPPGHRATF
ncbi:hypothetical protein WJX74_006610 [Apatococcus lobatus]|uniref:Kinesin motor domain-containing protein n=1 Tax=Apatococcus lobatus TaxID=904363 RepID=A0AAW1RRB9_9CHLO